MRVQCGPDSTRERSRTRMPSSGPGPVTGGRGTARSYERAEQRSSSLPTLRRWQTRATVSTIPGRRRTGRRRAEPEPPTSRRGHAHRPRRSAAEPVEPFEPAPPVEPDAPVPYEPVPPEYRRRRRPRRWPGSAKAIVIILAVLLVATAAGLGYGWWKTNDDKKDLETAQQPAGPGAEPAARQDEQGPGQTQQAADGGQRQGDRPPGPAARRPRTRRPPPSRRPTRWPALFPIERPKVQPGLPGHATGHGSRRRQPGRVQPGGVPAGAADVDDRVVGRRA